MMPVPLVLTELAAIRCGYHILLEKPISPLAAEIDTLEEALVGYERGAMPYAAQKTRRFSASGSATPTTRSSFSRVRIGA